ncbi:MULTISPECIES: hypothetical protein [unclassified Microcoleus]|nr:MULTISPECIES: hypothetical protein [unclassified Microcoleus]
MILVAIARACDRNFYVIFSVNSHVKKEAIAQFGRSIAYQCRNDN